jgi:hypothetical protein
VFFAFKRQHIEARGKVPQGTSLSLQKPIGQCKDKFISKLSFPEVYVWH